MKDIKSKLVRLFKQGYCTPQISKIARAVDEPSATIHYNIKKLEAEGAIRVYKAVFNYKKIDEGFCVYLFIKLTAKAGADPDAIVDELARYKEVDSADILSGEWDVVFKLRTKDQDEYYDVLKSILRREGVERSMSVITLRQVKTDFVLL